MPDFDARFSAGVTLTIWDDHAASVSRLNPKPTHPHKYQRATVGTEVEVRMTFEGVEAPMDADLAGLFSSDFAETPAATPPISSPAGQSSVQRFTPNAVGHYLWVMRHEGGGAIGLHLDAEA